MIRVQISEVEAWCYLEQAPGGTVIDIVGYPTLAADRPRPLSFVLDGRLVAKLRLRGTIASTRALLVLTASSSSLLVRSLCRRRLGHALSRSGRWHGSCPRLRGFWPLCERLRHRPGGTEDSAACAVVAWWFEPCRLSTQDESWWRHGGRRFNRRASSTRLVQLIALVPKPLAREARNDRSSVAGETRRARRAPAKPHGGRADRHPGGR
jgi:hypothetical protein